MIPELSQNKNIIMNYYSWAKPCSNSKVAAADDGIIITTYIITYT